MPMVPDILTDMESGEDEVDNFLTMIHSTNMEDLPGEDKLTETGSEKTSIGKEYRST
jgi:hypothetical protein